MWNHHKIHEPKIQCPKCPEKFFTKKQLKAHLPIHDPQIKCPKCKDKFFTEEELNIHLPIHDPKIQCPKCPMLFHRKDQLAAHMPVHDPNVSCPKCDETFFTKSEMEEHLVIHRKSPPRSPTPIPPELPLPDLPESPIEKPEEIPEASPIESNSPPESPKLEKRIYRRRVPKRKRVRRPIMAQTEKEPEPVADPLDFLAKYCIVVKDKLPQYKSIFTNALPTQSDESEEDVSYRLIKYRQKDEGEIDPFKVEEKNEETEAEEKKPNPAMIERRMQSIDYGFASAKEMLDRIAFTTKSIEKRVTNVAKRKLDLEKLRIQMVCKFARVELPDIIYDKGPKTGKKEKKEKGKKKGSPLELPTWMDMDQVENVKSDEYVMARLDTSLWDMIASDREIEEISLQIWRSETQLQELDKRIDELQEERIALLFCDKENQLKEKYLYPKSDSYRRKQSALYQMMNNAPIDPELDLDGLEKALRIVNENLLTEKEIDYIYFVLDLPSKSRINFKLFTVIASLSERIQMLDPFIRKLINKLDFDALQVKLDRAKELFALLAADENIETDDKLHLQTPHGAVPADRLGLELAAGGVSEENVKYVMEKFTREKQGAVEFLDYLTYVPLFIEIHENIIESPLSLERTY